jgi:glycosyltransferase involved in cell wall biosynthesis
MKISAVVLTKNEERNIKDCIKGLGFCNEIVVVDDNSSDNTCSIAKKMGARVFVHAMKKDFAAQSNFGMSKAKENFVFFVDADERITNKLAKEIKDVDFGDYNAFFFRRVDYMWGRWLKHGESGNSQVIRLVRKDIGKWVRRVHPYFDFVGRSSKFENPILHYPHQTLSKFVESVNRWSGWHAIANGEEGKKATLVKIFLWPVGHFTKNYILKMGFLDGMQGFIYASIMSAHSFLAWSKLWLIQRRNLPQN